MSNDIISPSLIKTGFIKSFFFGNYFYGICAVALSIEASLQQRSPLNDFVYYIFVFCTTVLYYTKAYISVATPQTDNTRLIWYNNNKQLITFSQVLLTVIALACSFLIINPNWQNIRNISLYQWVIIFVFPIVAGLYYGISNKSFGKYNLRSIGWMKPFVIGFTWAGTVTIYPVLFYCIEHAIIYKFTLVGSFLFLKNFMFVSVLCIMFDIKDYADDSNQKLKTFVTEFGLRKTIFYILIPLAAIGLGSFIAYGATHHFSLMKILMNTVPFILLLTVAYSLHNRRSIFYYLIIIDGLLLVKAVCGIIAMLYF